MSFVRNCCYKDCSTTSANQEELFFGFPKKTDSRYQQWVKLTQCDPEIKYKHICSKHFDLTRFMSSNPRRKILLNTTMPYEYVPSGNGVEEFNFSICTNQQEDTENIFVRETNDVHISDTGKFLISCKLLYYDFEFPEDYSVLSPKPKLARSHKKIVIKTKESQITPKSTRKPGYSEILEELDQSMMEEMAPHISTFIFKGEEYVQMPKKDYLVERELYLGQIRKFKNIFQKLKSTLNSFDDQ